MAEYKIQNSIGDTFSMLWSEATAGNVSMTLPPTLGLAGDSLTIQSVPTSTSMELQWRNTQPPPNPLIRTVAISPQRDEYSTIKAALASITDSSVGKPYLVVITPGSYLEDNLVIQPYISVEGMDLLTCNVIGGPSNHILVPQGHNEISKLSLSAPHDPGSGVRGISIVDVEDVRVEAVSINNCSVGVHVEGATAPTNLYIHNCNLRDVLDIGITIIGDAAKTVVRLYAMEITMTSGLGSPVALRVTGALSHADLSVSDISGAGHGTAIELLSGSRVTVSTTVIDAFTVGLSVPVQSSAPILIASAVTFSESVTTQICVLSPTTKGSLSGIVKLSKTCIIEQSLFFIQGQDSRIITIAKKGGNFTDLIEALDYIATMDIPPSVAFPLIISIGPGVFTIPAFTIPSHVLISGHGALATTLTPSAADITFITMHQHTIIRECTIMCPTGTGTGVFYAGGPLMAAGATLLDLNIVGRSTTGRLVYVNSDHGGEPGVMGVSAALFVVTNVSIFGVFTRGFDLNNTLGANVSLLSNSLTWLNAFGTVPPSGCTVIYTRGVNGTNMPLHANSVIVSANNTVFNDSSAEYTATTAIGIHATSFCNISLDGGTLSQMKTSIVMDGINKQIVRIRATLITNAHKSFGTGDILINNGNVVGAIRGTIDAAYITINPLADVCVNVVDPNTGDTSISGALALGDQFSTLTNATNSISAGTTVGIFSGGEVTLATQDAFTITAGSGYLVSAVGNIKYVTWSADQTITLLPNGDNYIVMRENGTLAVTAAVAAGYTVIPIARVHVDDGVLIFMQDLARRIPRFTNSLDASYQGVFGSMFESGGAVSKLSATTLEVSSGVYWFGSNRYEFPAATPVSFIQFFDSGAQTIAQTSTVNVSDRDDGSGGLTAIAPGQWVRHVLFAVNGGGATQFLFVFGTTEGNAEATAPLAQAPVFFTENIVAVASISVQGGSGAIQGTGDLRPRANWVQSAGVVATADHQMMSNRDDTNAHSQYLLRTGTGGMIGALDLNSNAISGITTLSDTTTPGDQIVISKLSVRLQPGGADELLTGTPVPITAYTNFAGSSTALAIADHQHGHGAQTDPTLHAEATAGASGFLAAADKAKLDGSRASPPSRGDLVEWGVGESLLATSFSGKALDLQNSAGSFSVQLKAPPGLSSSSSLQLPSGGGAAGQFMYTSGGPDATMSWGTPVLESAIFQVRTGSKQDINDEPSSFVQWDLTPDINDAIYTLSANNIHLIVAAAGRYEIYANIVSSAVMKNSKVRINFTLDGSPLPGQAYSTSDGALSNANLRTIVHMTAGSVLSVERHREGTFGAITLVPNESVWIVKTL
jgi:hypothetical protein